MLDILITHLSIIHKPMMFLFLQLYLELLLLLLIITFYEGQVMIFSESILNHQHPFSINCSKKVISVDAISSLASQYKSLNTLK